MPKQDKGHYNGKGKARGEEYSHANPNKMQKAILGKVINFIRECEQNSNKISYDETKRYLNEISDAWPDEARRGEEYATCVNWLLCRSIPDFIEDPFETTGKKDYEDLAPFYEEALNTVVANKNRTKDDNDKNLLDTYITVLNLHVSADAFIKKTEDNLEELKKDTPDYNRIFTDLEGAIALIEPYRNSTVKIESILFGNVHAHIALIFGALQPTLFKSNNVSADTFRRLEGILASDYVVGSKRITDYLRTNCTQALQRVDTSTGVGAGTGAGANGFFRSVPLVDTPTAAAAVLASFLPWVG